MNHTYLKDVKGYVRKQAKKSEGWKILAEEFSDADLNQLLYNHNPKNPKEAFEIFNEVADTLGALHGS